MSVSSTAVASGRTVAPAHTSVYAGGAFWERMWRTAGLQFVGLFVVAYAIYGYQPGVGASEQALVGFYTGERVRILIAAAVSGLAILNLMWFAAAIRATLADVGQDGWGGAATAASGAVGALSLLFVALGASLAYSIASPGNQALASGLNDLAWISGVVSAFPRAMLIMAGSFGLWRAGLISNAAFAACVAAVVLVLLGGTTWLADGIWAPDGAYTRFVSPLIALLWVVAVSGVLLTRSAAARAGW